ncbi:MAG TPA: FliM/FliN family flagellar motor switch protein [Planctomycetota bacterium]|nr:FliM/FliN family flagellar motor switch protein [Planctomycetota bacterium]
MIPEKRIPGDPIEDLLERFRREVDAPRAAGQGLPELEGISVEAERSGSAVRSEVVRSLRLRVKVELGRVVLPLCEALELSAGRILELGKDVGDPVTVLVGGVAVARGQVLVIDDRFCVRITEILRGDMEDEAQRSEGSS